MSRNRLGKTKKAADALCREEEEGRGSGGFLKLAENRFVSDQRHANLDSKMQYFSRPANLFRDYDYPDLQPVT